MLANDAAKPGAVAEPATTTPDQHANGSTTTGPLTSKPAAMAAEPTAAKPAAKPTDVGATSGPTVRTITGPAAEPIDAFSLGGSAILKRLLPVLGGLVVLALALRRLRK
jgi:hypothetical protein